MKKISVRIFTGMALAVLSVVLFSCTTMPFSQPMSQSQIEEQRASIRDMAKETLSQLYEQYPEAKSRVQRSAGYAVFSNFGVKYLFMGSATGQGVAVSHVTKRDTYMKMVELQPGYGFGAQQFKIIFLFDTQDALDSFVNSGWEFGGSGGAAAQTGTQGGGAGLGVSVSPGVTMYQISGTGAIVGVSVTGAKYYKDDALN
jgi:lipid-binding SYLF domain-containing protein